MKGKLDLASHAEPGVDAAAEQGQSKILGLSHFQQ